MANKPKVTKRLFNSVKKLAKTGANKTYIMKVSGLSNMTVYRILKAKTYEEYRGEVTRFSRKNNERAKDVRKCHKSDIETLRTQVATMLERQNSMQRHLDALDKQVDGIDDYMQKAAEEHSKKHWWSR